MNTPLSRRFWELMFGLFLIVIGLAALTEANIFAFGIMAFGFWMVVRQFDKTGRIRSDRPIGDEQLFEEFESQARPAGSEQVYAHAVEAVRQAGLDPSDTVVLPVDIGLMTFRADQDPVVHRTQPINDDVDYIQPFVQLRLPQRAAGRIRFEIADADGQVLFIHEDIRQLERGRNLITPASRLPIHDAQAMHANWELTVTADGVLLARHTFGWHESTAKFVRRQVHADGEISNELRAALSDSQPGSLSLDDLLSRQQSDDQQQQARR